MREEVSKGGVLVMGARDKYRGFRYRGKEYESLQEIFDEYEIKRSVYTKVRRRYGMSVTEALNRVIDQKLGEEVDCEEIEYRGKCYGSLNELCEVLSKETGIKRCTIYARVRRGMSIDDAVGRAGRVAGDVEFPVTFRGFEYTTQGALLEDWDVPYTTVYRYREEHGFNIIEAIEYYLTRNGK